MRKQSHSDEFRAVGKSADTQLELDGHIISSQAVCDKKILPSSTVECWPQILTRWLISPNLYRP